MTSVEITNEPLKIHILAPKEASDILIQLIPSTWNIVVSNTIPEVLEKLNNSISAILIHDRIIHDDPVTYLDQINEVAPQTRIVLFAIHMDLNKTIPLFNHGKIHRVIDGRSDNSDPAQIITSAVEEYLRLTKNNKHVELLKSRLQENREKFISEDRLLDLSLQLSNASEIKDFSNQFVSMIEGIQSFISINYSIYQDTTDEKYREIMIGYLSDLELLANQYDQKILLIYVDILRAYLYLQWEQLEKSMNFYKNSIRIFYWISTEYIEEKFIHIINSFPILEDEFYYIQTGEKDFQIDLKLSLNIRNSINILLNYDISRLTNLSETLYKNLKIKSDIIQSIMVVNESIPVFVYDQVEGTMEPALVSGFVEALSTFLQELVAGKGDIDHINHDKGVILIHKEKGLRFLLVASTDEIYLRMGLREFAKRTVDELEQLPKNENVNDDQYEKLVGIIQELFKINKGRSN